MQFDLTPEEINRINDNVANGGYESPDAIVCEALQLFKERMEESELVAAGLMRLPPEEKNDDFLDLPAPQVSRADIQAAIRAERDEE